MCVHTTDTLLSMQLWWCKWLGGSVISSPPDISNPRCCCLHRGPTWLPCVLACPPTLKKTPMRQHSSVCVNLGQSQQICVSVADPSVHESWHRKPIREHEESSVGVLNIALSSPRWPHVFNKGGPLLTPIWSGRPHTLYFFLRISASLFINLWPDSW